MKTKITSGVELQLYAKTHRRLAKAIKVAKSHDGVPVVGDEEISGEEEGHTSG